ncbi:MAG: tetratricopeptide repeat protein [Terrimicrobiaceae bacterium]
MKFLTTILLFSIFTAALAIGAPSAPKKSDNANANELFDSGTQKLLSGNYAAAEKDLRAAVDANDKDADAFNNLAFVLRKQGSANFEEALKNYNRAIALNDKLAEAYMYRGVLYQAMGKKDLALADHARLLALGNSDLANELEWVLKNGKEKEPAQFFGVVKTK